MESSLLDQEYLQWLKNLPELSPWWKEAADSFIARGKKKHQPQTKKVSYSVHKLLSDLKSCRVRKDLQWGRRIHAKVVESKNDSNTYVVAALIRMYAKCGSMMDARCLFDSIQKPDVVTWTILLMGYAENGHGLAGLELFSKMKACGCVPDSVTYVAALKACSSLVGKQERGGQEECLKHGREIHFEIGCNLNIFVQSTLIDMYAKGGSMEDARCVFDSIQAPDVVCWNNLLLGYTENGEGLVTLELFSTLRSSGCVPDSLTYVAALKACTSLGKQDGGVCLKWGRKIHSEIGRELDIFMQSALIDMYANCGSMVDARRVFDHIQRPDVVSWNALLMGYVDNGDGLATLEMFLKMKACKCTANSVTYIAALKGCTALLRKQDGGGQRECLKRGREIHSQIGCHLDIVVQNTLIDMYANCGSMIDARCVFDSIQKPNVVSWTALLLGYAENGDGLSTLDLFRKMKTCGCVPNSVTYVAALKACGLIGALAHGRKIHSEISEFTTHVVTCLVDFYGNCGSITEAREVFDAHSRVSDVSTWTALIAGYGTLGDTDSVFNLFQAMQDQGYRPNAVTFVCMLSCCSHAGLVEKARTYFESMSVQYGVIPTVKHYNCMVDILGRANQLDEAIALLQRMPCNPDVVTWTTLLGACHKWKNVVIGKCAFQSLMDVDKKNAAAYTLMANIYGCRGMWEDQRRVLEAKIKVGTWKLPEQSYAYDEVGNMVKFVVGEEDPPEVKKELEELLTDMKVHDYLNHSVADVQRDEGQCGHCERRAVVYGMLKTPPDEPVRAFKNTRMCDDCHGSTKLISKVSGRVIMVRDASKFHIMANGSCSCGDYW